MRRLRRSSRSLLGMVRLAPQARSSPQSPRSVRREWLLTAQEVNPNVADIARVHARQVSELSEPRQDEFAGLFFGPGLDPET
jgi:hypothetical protein